MKNVNRPQVGVGAVVFNDKGEILLVKRMYPPQQGKWAIPGGHLELGETIYDAAKRELFEETGLIGEPICIVNVDELIVKSSEGGIRRHYILIDVLFKINGGYLKADSDAEDVKFFDPSNAISLENVSYSTKTFLRKYVSGKIVCFEPVLNMYTE